MPHMALLNKRENAHMYQLPLDLIHDQIILSQITCILSNIALVYTTVSL